jgi:phosphohistidine phosphatase
MRILFIRHAEAIDAARFDGDDALRPLTKSGRRKATAAYRRLVRILPVPEVIVSSEAVRAVETAAILKKFARGARHRTSPLLNPGRGIQGFRLLFKNLRRQEDTVAVVGHEPDLSRIISSIVAQGKLNLRMKKGACADVEVVSGGRGLLRGLLSLDALTGSGVG